MKVSQIRKILRDLGAGPRHHLGQNFLLDERVVAKMVKAAGLDDGQTVLEVGPGLGVLTRALAANSKKVIAVELDDLLAGHIESEFQEKVRVVRGDIIKILKVGVGTGLDLSLPKKYSLVANLPYQITGHFFNLIFSQERKPERMVVMVQKEVAERIVEGPGKMTQLAFFAQWHAKARVAFRVAPRSFWPAPKVASAVVVLDPYEDPAGHWGVTPEGERKIFSLVKVGFSHKRKLLASNISNNLAQKSEIIKALESLGKSPKARAQELAIKDWIGLQKSLS